jgi:hypothetical protein
MEKIKAYQIETNIIKATSCDYCDDGIEEYTCYVCGRKLCFFCVKKVKDKYLCFFHYKLWQAFSTNDTEKGGEKIWIK